jgi:hypothetical protein
VVKCHPRSYEVGKRWSGAHFGVAAFLMTMLLALTSRALHGQTAAPAKQSQNRPACALNLSGPLPTPVATGPKGSGTRVERDPDDHRIVIDSDGILASTENITEDLRKMFGHIERTGRKRLVLFIHGGVTTLESANQNAKVRGPEIARDDPDAYPLFINWEAGLTTSYGRHLAYERNGTSYRGTPAAWSAVVITPLVFVADVGRSIADHSMNTVLNFSKVLENNDRWYQTHPGSFVTKNKFLETLREFYG